MKVLVMKVNILVHSGLLLESPLPSCFCFIKIDLGINHSNNHCRRCLIFIWLASEWHNNKIMKLMLHFLVFLCQLFFRNICALILCTITFVLDFSLLCSSLKLIQSGSGAEN